MLDLLLSAVRPVGAVLLVGNALIICHELGHFLAARFFGVQVNRFVIGFGPTLVRCTDRRGTTWSLSLLPLGGYVSFQDEQSWDQRGSYAARPPLVRIAIIAAGPVGNLLVAIAVFSIMLATSGEPAFQPVASSILPDSAAEHAGFQPGDRVLTMDGTPIALFEDMRPGLRGGAGKSVHFQVQRDGRVLDLFAGLGAIQQGGRTIGLLGFRSLVLTHVVLPPGHAIVRAAGKTWDAMTDTVAGIARVVTHGQGTENIAGVVGITQLTGQAAYQGIETLLVLVAILSVNLALMNLLPIPILDGGALLFCLAELVLRRPVSTRGQEFAMRAGFTTLATLFMLTTIHDLDGLGLFRWLAQL